MVFVCLAHFANSYAFPAGASEVGGYLVAIGMIASPTFVAVSGIVAGFMSVAHSNSFPHFRRKLVDRGVFLLLVGHAVLSFTGVFSWADFSHSYRIGRITDVIAVAVIIGPWLVVWLGQKERLLFAALIFALDWCAILFWQPTGGIGVLAKHYLVGLPNPADAGVSFLAFPVIPWFALYLVGTVIGVRLGTYYVRDSKSLRHLLLAKIGVASFVVGAGMKLALKLLRHTDPNFAQVHPNLMPLLSSYQKYPPGPAYLCFYGGAGFLLVAGVLEAERLGIQTFMLNQLRHIGQASLFSYIVQAQLYEIILRDLRLPYTPFWPFLFIVPLAMLATAAAAWNSIKGNRYLTVGLGPLLERNALRRLEIRDGQLVSTLQPSAFTTHTQTLSLRLRRLVS
jgi:hypothetical protein